MYMKLHSPILAPKRNIISILIGKTEVNKPKFPSSLAIEPSSDFPDQFFFWPMGIIGSLPASAQWLPLQHITFTQAGNIIKINYYVN